MHQIIKYEILIRIGDTEYTRSPVTELYFGDGGVLATISSDGKDYDATNSNVWLLLSSGAFDKNNKEIYQSDLLKDNDGKIFEVIKACASLFIVVDDKAIILTDDVTKNLEVIGNSIQNIDLVVSPEEFEKTLNKNKQ